MTSPDCEPRGNENDESSRSRRWGCLVYLTIAGAAALAAGTYLMSRWDTLPGLAKAGAVMLVVLGTLGLLPAVVILTLRILLKTLLGRVGKELSNAAQQMIDLNKDLYGKVHEFRPAEDEDFEELDRGYYEESAKELAQMGFRHLGDIVDQTVEEISGISPPIRVLASADGSMQVGLFHLLRPNHPAQPAGQEMLICDVSTEFSDGTFLLTSNTQESDLTTPSPQIRRQQHPLATSPIELVRAHEKSKQNFLAGTDGITSVSVHTLDDAIASEKRQQAAKNAFRQQIGYVDPEEVRRVADGVGGEPEFSNLAARAVDEARKREQEN